MSTLRIGASQEEGEGEAFSSTNPVNSEVVWRGNQASPAQVQKAAQAAEQALSAWAKRPVIEREQIVRNYAQLLTERSDELAQLISRETGKLLWECQGEVKTCIAKAELSIQAVADRRPLQSLEVAAGRAEVSYRPLGVVVVLGPFNFPAHLPGGQMIPALLAGNTVVFKPSEVVPAVGQWLADAWIEAGIPPGVVNLVQGDRMVAESAIDQPNVSGVMFTGSHRAGSAIHRRLAGRTDVLLTLEMGGNNPLVVIENGDLDQVAGAIIASAFITAGQRCTCARRLIVMNDASGDKILAALIDRIGRLRIGLPGDDPEPFIGPVISSAASDALLASQQNLIAAGGKPLVEMARHGQCHALLSPGVIDMTAAKTVEDEEYFGPLLQVMRVRDFDQAIDAANATRFGLAASLLGGNAADFERFRNEVRAGVINWNRQTTGASGALPFGGVGDSGNHRPVGFWAIDACSDPIASLLSESVHDAAYDRTQL